MTENIAKMVLDNALKSCLNCGYFWKVGFEEKGEYYSELRKNNPLYGD
jgi:hypothetical protein